MGDPRSILHYSVGFGPATCTNATEGRTTQNRVCFRTAAWPSGSPVRCEHSATVPLGRSPDAALLQEVAPLPLPERWLGRSGVTGVDVSESGAFRVIELGRHDVVGAVRVGRVREESHLDAVLAKRSVALRAGRWGRRFVRHGCRIDNAVSPLEPDSWRRLSRGKADAEVEVTLHQYRLP